MYLPVEPGRLIEGRKIEDALYFAFIWTKFTEVVMWQVQYAETIGLGLRVYG